MCAHLEATGLGEQCAARIKVLDHELSKALQKRHYPLKKSRLIQEAKQQLSLSHEHYKKQLSGIKNKHVEGLKALQRGDVKQYRTRIVACLLDTGELLQKVKIVAHSGGKELDDFSKNWRSCFPNYVTRLI